MTQAQSQHTAPTIAFWNGTIVALLLLIGAWINAPLCHAQLVTTGTINGSVLDQTGAAVTGADVVITNEGTKTETKTISNSEGSFSQVGLQSGNYNVTVSSPGFDTFTETSIYLEPTGTYTVHVALKPGEVSNTVTVTANQLQPQTTTSEISNTVSGAEAQILPLNGRNYAALGSLMPGVTTSPAAGSMGAGGYLTDNSINVNGSGLGGSLYTLDGVWNSNTVEHNQQTIIPNPDEIAEIKVLQNNYNSQYALKGTGVIMVQTKSGTDKFHGGAWEFLRNTVLDTRNYFAPVSSGVPAEEWNIFGWNLGGPLSIPKLYNGKRKKTFFYFNQQWVQQKQQSVLTGATPTAAMRVGTFPLAGSNSPYMTKANGGWLRDPKKSGACNATSQVACFPNNQIPQSRIDPNALALLNALAPLPNATNTFNTFNNYINTLPTRNNQMDIEAKIDQTFSSMFHLTGEYFYEGDTSTSPSARRMGSPFSPNYDVFQSKDQIAQIQLTQILTPSMTNQTSVAMSNLVESHDFGGIRLISQLSGFDQKLPYSGGFLQNYLPHVGFAGGWSQFGTSACCIIPRATSLNDTVADDWSWLRGKHFLQAGFILVRSHDRQWNTGGPLSNGGFFFNGQFTGNSIADYLLGDTASFGQGDTAFRKYMYAPIVTPYFEDQWRATRRLTINAGLRWFYMPGTSTQTGTSAVFVIARFNPANAPVVSQSGVITPTPTYDPGNGMVINGKNGIPQNLTNAHNYYLAPVFGFALDVYGNGRTSLRGGYGITYNKNTEDNCGSGCVNPPLLNSVDLINTTFTDPAGGGKTPPATAPGTSGEDLQGYQATKIQSYSLSWQQEFGTNWLASIAGAGDSTSNSLLSVNINQPGPVAGYDFTPLLNTGKYSNAYFAPYQGYSNIGYARPIGWSNWNALELGLKHSVGSNLYLTAAYTWSHLQDIGGIQNAYAIRSAYESGGVPQVFTMSLVYSLPLLKGSSRLVRSVLGGWQYSDTTILQDGSFDTLGMSLPNTGLANRPNQIAPVTYPKQWKKPGGLWFSTASFAKPAPGFFGNVGNNTLRGPGLVNSNMAAYKTFGLYGTTNLQFRAEFFNVFNHTNPNGPNTNLGAGTFGLITSAGESRVGELALKLNF
ncbi:MAG: carboxypeptidase-like regulatory domain-containing protein [Acidobacteriaceae bacterium]